MWNYLLENVLVNLGGPTPAPSLKGNPKGVDYRVPLNPMDAWDLILRPLMTTETLVLQTFLYWKKRETALEDIEKEANTIIKKKFQLYWDKKNLPQALIELDQKLNQNPDLLK